MNRNMPYLVMMIEPKRFKEKYGLHDLYNASLEREEEPCSIRSMKRKQLLCQSRNGVGMLGASLEFNLGAFE